MVSTTEKPLHDPCGGHPALDFANTFVRIVGDPPFDAPRGYANLLTWSALAGTLTRAEARALARRAEGRSAEAAEVLARARPLREAIRSTFRALSDGARPAGADLAAINAELALSLAHARVEGGPEGFVWSWDDVGEHLDAPLWPLARATGELLTRNEPARIRQCASDSCRWLFLDASRNGARRWCEMKVCGNRAKVRKHRARRRDAEKT